MRRLVALVVAALLVAPLLALPAAAATGGAGAADVVLAAEAGEPTGPPPAPRDAEANPARELVGYEDREVQFTWGAAWILLFAGLAGLVVLLGVYRWLVQKPGS